MTLKNGFRGSSRRLRPNQIWNHSMDAELVRLVSPDRKYLQNITCKNCHFTSPCYDFMGPSDFSDRSSHWVKCIWFSPAEYDSTECGVMQRCVQFKRRLSFMYSHRASFLEIPEELYIVLLKGSRRAVRRVILMNTIELLQFKVS